MNYQVNKSIEFKGGKRKIKTCDNYDRDKCKTCIDKGVCSMKNYTDFQFFLVLIFVIIMVFAILFAMINFKLIRL